MPQAIVTLVREIAKHDSITRAELMELTGMPKATFYSVINSPEFELVAITEKRATFGTRSNGVTLTNYGRLVAAGKVDYTKDEIRRNQIRNRDLYERQQLFIDELVTGQPVEASVAKAKVSVADVVDGDVAKTQSKNVRTYVPIKPNELTDEQRDLARQLNTFIASLQTSRDNVTAILNAYFTTLTDSPEQANASK